MSFRELEIFGNKTEITTVTSLSITNESIKNLNDVDISYSTISDGQALVWNDASGVWKPGNVAAGGGSGTTNSVGVNIVNVSSGTTAIYTPPKSSPGVEIESLRVSITPTAADSVIELNWKVFCDGYRNVGFRVTRNINAVSYTHLRAHET